MTRKQKTTERLEEVAAVLSVIEANQLEHPRYAGEIAESMVRKELRLLLADSERYWRDCPDGR